MGVYAFFTVVEGFTDILLYWIPFYYGAKIVFLVYLMSPHFKGASVVFHKFVEPLLDRYATKIDSVQREVSEVAQQIGEQAGGAVSSAVKDVAAKAAEQTILASVRAESDDDYAPGHEHSN